MAASTFSTLCWPRSAISASGQISSTWPLSLADDPAVAHEDAVVERRAGRLNQSTRPRVRDGQRGGGRVVGVEHGAVGRRLVARRCAPWPRRSASKVPCRSRWSGVMLRTPATRGWKASMVSSWKRRHLGHDQAVGAGSSSACAASGVPMLPPTSTGRGCSRQERAGERGRGGLAVGAGDGDVVGLHRPPAELELADDRHARARAPAPAAGASSGTPGLTTTSSAPSNAASGSPPVESAHARRARAPPPRGRARSSGLRRRRRAPRRRPRGAAAPPRPRSWPARPPSRAARPATASQAASARRHVDRSTSRHRMPTVAVARVDHGRSLHLTGA